MRRLPDILIAAGVIVATVAIPTGYHWVGAISLLIALIVGWRRDWCMDSLEELASSGGGSALSGPGDNGAADVDAGDDH